MLGGDRLIAVHLAGQGKRWSAPTARSTRSELPAGQEVIVDLGHLVGYEDTMSVNVQTQVAGLANSFKSGEMVVVKVAGPGRVWTQSRSERELADWVRQQVPTNTN